MPIARKSFWVTVLLVVWLIAPTTADAGEFKPGRYIAPSRWTDILTRHVRKGIIKRIRVTENQLAQIESTLDPYRGQLAAQITSVGETRLAVVDAMAAHPYDEIVVRSSHARAASAELELSLTAAAIFNEVREILDSDQLLEVEEVMEEIRQAFELRFADIRTSLAAVEPSSLERTPRTQPAVE